MSHNEKQGTAILCVCLVSYTCVYGFVYACACLLAWSVCASVPMSITVSGWAGNGRMKLWQRPVTPTPFPLCAAVSPCLINVVRSVAHGEISVSGWAWTVLCHPLCSRSGVYTWQWVGMCCWCDSPLWLGCTLGACICYMQCYHPGHMRFEEDTCLWVTGRILTLVEKWYLSSGIFHGTLINKSHLCSDSVCESHACSVLLMF